jgi:hypothetical protein
MFPGMHPCMLWKIGVPLVLAAAVALLPSAAQAAPTSLPTVSRALSANRTTTDSCPSAKGAGTDRATYAAPMSGYLSARLSAPDTSDWDLVLRDAETGRTLSASQAFGSHEVVQTWVRAGQKLVAQGCRESGARRASIGFTLVDASSPKPVGPVSLARVTGSSKQLDALGHLGLDVTENAHGDAADVLVAGSKQLDALRASGLPYQTRIADMNAYAARNQAADARAADAGPSALPSGRQTYRTYEDIQAELKKLVADNPGLVRPIDIGTSFQGRHIQGVEIANDVNGSDGRPVFFLMALHHAREWPSAEAAMEYATLLTKQRNKGRIAALLASERTVIVPLVNPDGFVSSRSFQGVDPADAIRDPDTGAEQDLSNGLTPSTVEAIAPPGGILTYRRKNCDGAVPNGNMPCELQWGIDPNRNYGNLWGGPGASQDPTSQSYHGPGPRSEPEVQAVWNYSRTHQVTTLISLHNVAALVLRPPGLHGGGKAPDEARMKEIGDAMASATGYTSEYGFQLYDTAGTTEDDTYAAEGGYGYTIEIGPENGAFHMPYQIGVVDEWTGGNPKANNRGGLQEALLVAGEAAANPADHAILRGSAPAGATLRLHRDFTTTTSRWCAMGADPVVNPAIGTPLDAFLACPGGVQDPKTLNDNLDSTTVVPGSGQFDWHVNQSTRPFVGGGALIETPSDTSSRTDTFTGGGPGSIPTSSEDRPFTVTSEDHADLVKIRVTWGTPEDYDIVVYKGVPGDPNAKEVGSSGHNPGVPEEVDLEHPDAGDYFVQVNNFAAAAGKWTATIERFTTVRTVTTGHKEAYTLTCESGGKVLATHDVIIDRGQAIDLNPCSTDAAADAQPGNGPTPSVNGRPVASGAGAPGAVTPKAATTKSTSRAKARARAKRRAHCRAKAKKIKSRSKRARALRRCSPRRGTRRRAR